MQATHSRHLHRPWLRERSALLSSSVLSSVAAAAQPTVMRLVSSLACSFFGTAGQGRSSATHWEVSVQS